MTPDQLPGALRAIAARAEAAAIPVADALATTYKRHLVSFTLLESGTHPPVTRTPAPPGRPPAMMTGELAGSVRATPATGGGGVAEASVAPHTVYAATQEWGGDHYARRAPHMWLWLKYVGAVWPRDHVHIPARPFMRTAVAEMIADGELERAGEAAFNAAVWGR